MSRRSERGQILPIAAVAIVVLIGIAGLVMDVGFTWMLLRREQAAVDVATIAAARHIPDGNLAAMEEAACFYARENGFFEQATANSLSDTGCVPANDTFGAVLTVNFPPGAGPYEDRAGYVEVILNASHRTFFAGVFGINSMPASANAISANVEQSGDAGGQLVALDPTSCGAGMIRGNGAVDVEGNVYVNSDGTTDGLAPDGSVLPPCPGTPETLSDDACSGSSGAFMFQGGNAILKAPLVSVRGICGQNSNPYPAYCTDPCAMNEAEPQIEDPFNLVTPTIAWAGTPDPGLRYDGSPVDLSGCDAADDLNGCTFGGGGRRSDPPRWYELHPGTYYAGWAVQGTVCLHPGFYYFAGGGIQVTSAGRIVTLDEGETCATVSTSQTLGGDGRILLYGTDGPNCPSSGEVTRQCQGVISIEGQGGFQARGYEKTNTVVRDGVTDEDYHRFLVWQSQYKENGVTPTRLTFPGDTNFPNDKIRIAGQGYLNFWGTIYAPKSLVEIQGQGSSLPGAPDNTAGVQVVSWRWDIGGQGALDMPYVADELSAIVAKGLVH